MDGGGADDAVRPPDALGQVADGHLDAQGTQVGDGSALLPVRAGDDHAGFMKDLGQRGHGYAPDAHQMGPAAGGDERMNIGVCHGFTHPFL